MVVRLIFSFLTPFFFYSDYFIVKIILFKLNRYIDLNIHIIYNFIYMSLLFYVLSLYIWYRKKVYVSLKN